VEKIGPAVSNDMTTEIASFEPVGRTRANPHPTGGAVMFCSPSHAKALYGLLAAAALGGCNLVETPLVEGTQSLSAPHVAGTPLRVETDNGEIIVRRAEGDVVQIVGHVRAVSQVRLDATQIAATRDDDQTLVVSVEWPDGKTLNREGCSFEIAIPDAVGITLHTNNGQLSVADLGGEAELRTANGAIDVSRHDGPVDCETNNGAITVTDAAGAVQAKSMNGTVRIGLAADAPGPVQAQTYNGAIDLAIGPAFVGRLEISTMNGGVSVDKSVSGTFVSSSGHRAELTFGDSEQRSSASTFNGAVRVRSVAATQSELAN
jgi:hypothetical protein